jgi:hypothetical protein
MNEVARARPIDIKIVTNQYSLNNVAFDPTQNSPPSLWKMRLHKRIGDTPLKKTPQKIGATTHIFT